MPTISNVLTRLEQAVSQIDLGKSNRRYDLAGILLVLPVVLMFIFVTIIPVLYGVWLSFNAGPINNLSWVGLQNYIELLNSSELYSSMKIGAIYALYTVFFQVILGTAIALSLNNWTKGASIVRAFIFAPYMIPTVAVVTVAEMVLNPQIGILNWALWKLNLIPGVGAINWYSVDLAIHTIAAVSIWRWTIFAVILILARLQSIDQTLYDMAKANGASLFRQFIDITYPSIRSVLLLVVLLRGIWMFNKFDVIWLMTSGGPLGATTSMVVLAYEQGFNQFRFGMAAAITVIIFLLLMVVGIIYFTLFEPEGEVEVQQ